MLMHPAGRPEPAQKSKTTWVSRFGDTLTQDQLEVIVPNKTETQISNYDLL